MTAKPQALIIGAGIAGLSAAWWLNKAGWSSTLVERAPAIRDGGYILSLSGPCLDTLKRMDLIRRLQDYEYKLGENVLRSKGGHELLRLQYEEIHGTTGSLAVCRDDLARVLFAALPETAEVLFDETVTSIVDNGDKVQATLKNGKTVEADLLIGSDGIRSDIREQFWSNLRCGGKYDLESDCVSFNSPSHLDVLYQLRNDRVAALHIWRSDNKEALDRHYGFGSVRSNINGGSELVSAILDKAEEVDSKLVADTLTMVNLPKWYTGRVLLLGDAAHCLTLMSGQGAGVAISSAEILSKALLATDSLSQALQYHDQYLRPTIDRLQQRSRRLATMYIPSTKTRYLVRNFFMKIMPHSWVVSWHVKNSNSEVAAIKDY